MPRSVQQGSLAVDFPVEPFHSAPKLLIHSAQVFFRNIAFVATVTLAVFLPIKLAIQGICELFDVPLNGLLTYFLLDISDLVLSSLVTPAVTYGLLVHFRGKPLPPLAESLSWGRRQWGKTLWNKFKVEITVMLWGAMLVIPGVIAMVRLAFTDSIVAIEGDDTTAVLERSQELADGHRWRIFFVILPVLVVELAGSYFILGAFAGGAHSRVTIAVVDSLLSIGGQWAGIVGLLMYLGLRGRD
jgi:hypothetical protein